MAERADLEHAEREANSLKRYGDVNGFEDLADFAALTLAMVAECKAGREWAKVAATALEACRDPWYSAPDHGDPTCPDASCPACWRQEEEARELARIALNAYDQATGRPGPAAGHESGDTSASQLPPPPAGVRQDLDERERRKATAEFLRTERERYEYLLACAKDAEDEELAWEPIVARVTVGDFIRAAKEVLAFRAAAGHAEPEGPP